jgi:hypothetical protein
VITYPDGKKTEDSLSLGEIKVFELKEGEKAKVEISPTNKFDLGEGKGKKLVKEVAGGVVGLVIDARGRPLDLDGSKGKEPIGEVLSKWNRAFDAYPE